VNEIKEFFEEQIKQLVENTFDYEMEGRNQVRHFRLHYTGYDYPPSIEQNGCCIQGGGWWCMQSMEALL